MQNLIKDETEGIADKIIMELPVRQKKAILLYWKKGLTYKQIAGKLNISESASNALLVKARRKLREELGINFIGRRQ